MNVIRTSRLPLSKLLHRHTRILLTNSDHLQSSTSYSTTRRSSSSSSKPGGPMQAIKNTIAENFGGPVHSLAKPEHQFDIDKDVPDLSGKVAVVTGGSQGIGYATGFVMLRNNLKKLFIVSPTKETADGAINDISEKLGADYASRVQWVQTDLSDFKATTDAVETIKSATDRLDILVLNAGRGIMTYEIDQNGLDRHMSLNHIAHVIFCSHLLPLLKSTAEKHGTVRIQMQSSNAHQGAPSDVKFASVDELNTDLGPNGQYGRSKLAVLLYARYLDRHLHKEHPKILINATHPGFVETKMSIEDIHEPYPILGYGMSVAMSPFKKDQWKGATSTLFAATKTESSGQYICPPAVPEEGSGPSNDVELGEQLMKLTRDIIRTKFSAQSVDKGCPLKDY